MSAGWSDDRVSPRPSPGRRAGETRELSAARGTPARVRLGAPSPPGLRARATRRAARAAPSRSARRTSPSRTRPARSRRRRRSPSWDRIVFPASVSEANVPGQDQPRRADRRPGVPQRHGRGLPRRPCPQRPPRAAARSSRCCSRCPARRRTGTCTPAAGTPARPGRAASWNTSTLAPRVAPKPEADRGHQVPRRHHAAQQQPEHEQDDDRGDREHHRVVVVDRALDIGEHGRGAADQRVRARRRGGVGAWHLSGSSSRSPPRGQRVIATASPCSRRSAVSALSAGAATEPTPGSALSFGCRRRTGPPRSAAPGRWRAAGRRSGRSRRAAAPSPGSSAPVCDSALAGMPAEDRSNVGLKPNAPMARATSTSPETAAKSAGRRRSALPIAANRGGARLPLPRLGRPEDLGAEQGDHRGDQRQARRSA